MSSRWVTLREAAAILGVSLRTIQRKIKTGELEAREGRAGREHGDPLELSGVLGVPDKRVLHRAVPAGKEPRPAVLGAQRGASGLNEVEFSGVRAKLLVRLPAGLEGEHPRFRVVRLEVDRGRTRVSADVQNRLGLEDVGEDQRIVGARENTLDERAQPRGADLGTGNVETLIFNLSPH